MSHSPARIAFILAGVLGAAGPALAFLPCGPQARPTEVCAGFQGTVDNTLPPPQVAPPPSNTPPPIVVPPLPQPVFPPAPQPIQPSPAPGH